MSPSVTFHKILVPHDGSKSSDRALEYAVKISIENKECEIIIMHVIPPLPILFPSSRHERIKASSPSFLHDIYEQMESNANKILDKLKQSWASSSDVSIRTHVVVGGNVAQRIVEYAKKHAIDLIVINSRSCMGSSSRLKFWVPIGSVSRAVSEMAPCPVLLVRPVQK
jgi:nucleotide-binding universal stress UspA family protein